MDARVSVAQKQQRPFLKWAGNKYAILQHIKARLPPGKRLIEPFAGSGAVFLNTDYKTYLLCDANPDLINLFNLIKQQGPQFIRYGKRYFNGQHNNAESYYALRDKFNRTRNLRQKAALFIYLNRHGYNGLCRYNASGGFNVPFGRYKRPYYPEKELHAFHQKAQHAIFEQRAFEDAFTQAKKGDVIYCDPPYAPLSDSANFTSYSAGGFSLEQQQHLAELAEHTARRGIPVLLSNHNTRFIRTAYENADHMDKFHVRRFISCNGNKRNHVGEVLALYHP